MARYDYTCAACSRRFEVVHGIHEDGPTSCPLCGEGPVRKAFAAPTIHFKGSGWAKKERRAAKPSGSSADGGGGDGDGSATAATAASTGDGGSTPAKDTAKDAAATTTSAAGD